MLVIIEQYHSYAVELLKKIIRDTLHMCLENNNVFYKYPFEFRENNSTNQALTEITEQIRNACDKGLYTWGVYLDLQEVFDTIKQNILLAKLIHYGIKGTSFDWFMSFICDRVQQIVSHGVPQGSVLLPLLFIVFINYLNKSVNNSKVHYYDGDTNMLLREKSLKKINKQATQDLDLIICRWLLACKISLNTSKTETIIFRPKQKQIAKHLNFRISGHKINTCSKVRYLGIILEEHWNQINSEAPSDLLQKSRSEIREYITNKSISNY